MNPDDLNRRESKRILFSREDDITADVYLPNKPKKAVPAFILNISEQGMGILIPSRNIKKLKIAIDASNGMAGRSEIYWEMIDWNMQPSIASFSIFRFTTEKKSSSLSIA